MAQFWEHVEKTKDAESLTTLAQELDLHRQQIYEAKRGAIHADVFFCVMTDLDWNYSDLRPLPPVPERALAAFRLAIQHLRLSEGASKSRKPKKVEITPRDPSLIPELDFFALSFLLSDSLITSPGIRLESLGGDQWREVRSRVVLRLQALAKFPRATLDGVSREYLLACYRTWADFLSPIRDAIPLKWRTRAESKRS